MADAITIRTLPGGKASQEQQPSQSGRDFLPLWPYMAAVTTKIEHPHILMLPWMEPAHALAALGDEPGVMAFVGGGSHPQARWSCLMADPAHVRVWTEGDVGEPFEGLDARLEETTRALHSDWGPFQGGWAGLLSYELGRAFETLPWPGADQMHTRRPPQGPTRESLPDLWPDLWLGFYECVAIFDRHERRAAIVAWGPPALAHERAKSLQDKLLCPVVQRPHFSGAGLEAVQPRESVEQAIARTIDYIHEGDIFQANISARFTGFLPPGDRPLDLFLRLTAAHPSPFAAFLVLQDRAVVSHSPERFLSRTEDGQLETRPIKGTAPRHKDPTQDQSNAEQLLASQKDRAENLMIVDLMRNDLARVCEAGSVKVPRLCALESFTTVHHLVSDVIGQQRPGLTFFDALKASFPPGSITGAPKVRAMEIIAELEGEPRGPWCGAMIRCGFDGQADSSVLIRTAACVRAPHGAWALDARAGAGIVADSLPSAEYDEMLGKVRALRVAARGPA
jgi:para-aminobenzoate synthetase component I